MTYFRIGYCPPNPGPWGSPYGSVRAYYEKEIDNAIEYAIANPHMQIYMKSSYRKAYRQIILEKLLSYNNV